MVADRVHRRARRRGQRRGARHRGASPRCTSDCWWIGAVPRTPSRPGVVSETARRGSRCTTPKGSAEEHHRRPWLTTRRNQRRHRGYRGPGTLDRRQGVGALEQAGHVRCEPGVREGPRRPPDRWSVARLDEPSGGQRVGGRLRRGPLDELVLGYLMQHESSDAYSHGRRQRTGAVLRRSATASPGSRRPDVCAR
jgi:hypothetical protein